MDSDEEAWQRSRGIARTFVNISSDQEQLLESFDCWRPPKPGSRAPIANVPLKVLQAFTAKVDARQKQVRINRTYSGTDNKAKPSTLVGSRSSPSLPETGEQSSANEASDEEPEVLVSSSQWPPSPLDNVLPPDSSQEEETTPISRNLVGRKASFGNNGESPPAKSERLRLLSLGPSSPTGPVKDDDAPDHCSIPLLVSGPNVESTQPTTSSVVQTSVKIRTPPQSVGTPPQSLIEPLSSPLQQSQTASEPLIIHRTNSSTPHSGIADLNVCSMPSQASRELYTVHQPLEEPKRSPIGYSKLGLTTVQVDRTPDQLSNRIMASSSWPEGPPPKSTSDKARSNSTAVPNTMQNEVLQGPNIKAQRFKKTFEENELESGSRSPLAVKQSSYVKTNPTMQESRAEKPRKRLKIQGDFAFAQIYDSLDTINRASRQDRREFLASYSALEKVVHLASSDAKPEVAELSLFDRFKQNYPTYGGEAKHFWNMCHRIKILHNQDRAEHPSLWDDYIIRSQDEYRAYLLQCAGDAVDPLPFDRYYRIEISEPLYTGRIVTPRTLREAPSAQKEEMTAAMPIKRPPPSTSNTTDSSMPRRRTSTSAFLDSHNDKDIPMANERSSKRKSQKSRRNLPWQQGSSATVDLTLDSASEGNRSPSVELPQLHNLPRGQSTNQRAITSSLQSNHSVLTTANSSPRKEATLPHSVIEGNPISGPESTPPKPAEWWQDPHTPFKEFVRADLAIRSGKGNAFAKPATNTTDGPKGERKLVREPRKRMDVLSWK